MVDFMNSNIPGPDPVLARINAIAALCRANRYLEIGVKYGKTFFHVNVPYKYAVAPYFLCDIEQYKHEKNLFFFPVPSDDFFVHMDTVYEQRPLFDIIFIDGLHTFEQSFRDFENSLAYSHERTVWILDDTVPSDPYSAVPDCERSLHLRKLAGVPGTPWHGDVFKTVLAIHDKYPEFSYCTVLAENPQTVVWRKSRAEHKPLFTSQEQIANLSYFDMLDYAAAFCPVTDDMLIDLLAGNTPLPVCGSDTWERFFYRKITADEGACRDRLSQPAPLASACSDTITDITSHAKISLIVPIYNGAKHLPHCLHSILTQQYKNLEVLCINDGSSDASQLICESFAQADPRIRVYNSPQNCGVASARNRGLDMASGEYIQLVDQDDWLPADACSTLLQAAVSHKSPVVRGGYCVTTEDGRVLLRLPVWTDEPYSYMPLREGFTLASRVIRGHWTYLIEREFLRDTRYYEKIPMYDDLCFLTDIYFSAPKITLIPQLTYFHRTCAGSLGSSRGFKERTSYWLEYIDYLYNKAHACNCVALANNVFFGRMLSQGVWFFIQLLQNEKVEAVIDALQALRNVFIKYNIRQDIIGNIEIVSLDPVHFGSDLGQHPETKKFLLALYRAEFEGAVMHLYNLSKNMMSYSFDA